MCHLIKEEWRMNYRTCEPIVEFRDRMYGVWTSPSTHLCEGCMQWQRSDCRSQHHQVAESTSGLHHHPANPSGRQCRSRLDPFEVCSYYYGTFRGPVSISEHTNNHQTNQHFAEDIHDQQSIADHSEHLWQETSSWQTYKLHQSAYQ